MLKLEKMKYDYKYKLYQLFILILLLYHAIKYCINVFKLINCFSIVSDSCENNMKKFDFW